MVVRFFALCEVNGRSRILVAADHHRDASVVARRSADDHRSTLGFVLDGAMLRRLEGRSGPGHDPGLALVGLWMGLGFLSRVHRNYCNCFAGRSISPLAARAQTIAPAWTLPGAVAQMRYRAAGVDLGTPAWPGRTIRHWQTTPEWKAVETTLKVFVSSSEAVWLAQPDLLHWRGLGSHRVCRASQP